MFLPTFQEKRSERPSSPIFYTAKETHNHRSSNDVFLFNSTSTGVDVVYLWVNGSDPIRKEQLRQVELPAHKNAASANRWREWNELFYCLVLLFEKKRHAVFAMYSSLQQVKDPIMLHNSPK